MRTRELHFAVLAVGALVFVAQTHRPHDLTQTVDLPARPPHPAKPFHSTERTPQQTPLIGYVLMGELRRQRRSAAARSRSRWRGRSCSWPATNPQSRPAPSWWSTAG